MRCDRCGKRGQPYRYHGQEFSGLCAYEGENLCPSCRDHKLDEQVNRPVGWAQVPASQYITPVAWRYR
jgi:hypothetical protein